MSETSSTGREALVKAHHALQEARDQAEKLAEQHAAALHVLAQAEAELKLFVACEGDIERAHVQAVRDAIGAGKTPDAAAVPNGLSEARREREASKLRADTLREVAGVFQSDLAAAREKVKAAETANRSAIGAEVERIATRLALAALEARRQAFRIGVILRALPVDHARSPAVAAVMMHEDRAFSHRMAPPAVAEAVAPWVAFRKELEVNPLAEPPDIAAAKVPTVADILAPPRPMQIFLPPPPRPPSVIVHRLPAPLERMSEAQRALIKAQEGPPAAA